MRQPKVPSSRGSWWASMAARAQLALPVAGSSGTPSSGANMRARRSNSSALRTYRWTSATIPRAARASTPAMFVRARSSAARSPSSATRNGSPTEATRGSCVRVTTSSGESDTAAATSAVSTDAPSERVSGAASSHQMAPPSRLAIVIGTSPAFSSKVTSRVRSSGPNSPARARAKAVPTLGWPANGTSVVGVKMRTRRVCPRSAGSTNALSEKLNSRAICCICRSESPRASGSTARGLPPKSRSVKTSQRK